VYLGSNCSQNAHRHPQERADARWPPGAALGIDPRLPRTRGTPTASHTFANLGPKMSWRCSPTSSTPAMYPASHVSLPAAATSARRRGPASWRCAESVSGRPTENRPRTALVTLLDAFRAGPWFPAVRAGHRPLRCSSRLQKSRCPTQRCKRRAGAGRISDRVALGRAVLIHGAAARSRVYQRGNSCRGSRLHRRNDMRVGVERHDDARMAEPLLNNLRMDAGSESERRVRVSE